MKINYLMSKAEKDDIIGIYNLLHRDFIKKYSKNSEKFEWERHKKWYEFWLKSPYYLIYVLKDLKGKIIGQIRYELDGELAIINIYLAKENRKKGIAKIFVKESIEELSFEKNHLKLVVAYVLEENKRSQNLFLNLDFLFDGKKIVDGIEYLVYIKKINS